MECPLITLVQFGYKQEQFIRAAVQGALAQTYSPLEIILSDDCSPDRTFDIMREMAAAYKGPHRVILSQSPTNHGFTDHVNRVVNLAHGELLVMFEGDDISLPERVERTVAAWQAESPRPLVLFSNATVLGADGQPKGLMFDGAWRDTHNQQVVPTTLHGYPWVLGATLAFSPQLFADFGPIDRSVVQEDVIIPFRARLLGGIKYLNADLLRYRRHSQNSYDMQANQVAAHSPSRRRENRDACARQKLKDLRTARRARWIAASVYWHQCFVVSFSHRLESISALSADSKGGLGGNVRALELRAMYLALRILRRLEHVFLKHLSLDRLA